MNLSALVRGFRIKLPSPRHSMRRRGSRLARAAALAAWALCGVGCESKVTLEVQFVLPEKLQPLDVGRLAVRSEEEHSPYEEIAVPEPGPDRGDGCGPFLVNANGFTVRCTYVGNATRSILTAWYDTDKSGNMTRGDFTGSSKASVARTPLLKLSGIGQGRDVVMTEVTTGPPAKPPGTP